MFKKNMIKVSFILLLCLLANVFNMGILNVQADGNVVVFNDENLENEIRRIIDKPDGDIYLNEVEKIEYIEIRGYTITSLEGLQYLTNLTSLEMTGCDIQDISLLSSLTKLEYLNLNRNSIENIDVLAGLTNLKYLRLENNYIENFEALRSLDTILTLELGKKMEGIEGEERVDFDISVISNNRELDNLRITDMDLSNCGMFSNFNKLRILDLTRTNIDDISSFDVMTELEILNLAGTEISDISSLAGLTNINHLTIQESEIADLSPLKDLVNIKQLFLQGGVFTDISPLKKITNIEKLAITQSKVSDISVVENFTKLTMLSLQDGKITDIIPVSNLTLLEELDLKGNEIDDFQPIAGLQNLEQLILSSTGFEAEDTGDIIGLGSLKRVYLSGNPILSLGELEKLPKHTEVVMWGLKSNPHMNHRYKTMESKLKHIKEEIDNADTQIEKVLRINDYVCDVTKYSDNVVGMTGESAAIIGGLGFCSTYSNTVSLLCNLSSVEDQVIGGEGHSWNIVNIDDEWYHIDVTWNCSYGFDYFMISDDKIKTLRSGKRFDWTSPRTGNPKTVPCDSSKYENLAAFLDGYHDSTQVFFDSEYVYYTDSVTNKIMKSRIDMSGTLTLNETPSRLIDIKDGRLYYIVLESNELHNMSTDGSDDIMENRAVVIHSNYLQNGNNIPVDAGYQLKFNKKIHDFNSDKIYFKNPSNEIIKVRVSLKGENLISISNEITFRSQDEYELIIEEGALSFDGGAVSNSLIKRFFSTEATVEDLTMAVVYPENGVLNLDDEIKVKLKFSVQADSNWVCEEPIQIKDSYGNNVDGVECTNYYEDNYTSVTLKFNYNPLLKAGERYTLIIPRDNYIGRLDGSRMKDDFVYEFRVVENPKTPGSIKGKIINIKGVRVPNVKVDLEDMNGELIKTTLTDADGEYIFADLEDGTYKIVITGGFAVVEILDGKDVQVQDFRVDEDILNSEDEDLNKDGSIDANDLWILLEGYGMLRGDNNFDSNKDLNDDTIIDLYDLIKISKKIK